LHYWTKILRHKNVLTIFWQRKISRLYGHSGSDDHYTTTIEMTITTLLTMLIMMIRTRAMNWW